MKKPHFLLAWITILLAGCIVQYPGSATPSPSKTPIAGSNTPVIIRKTITPTISYFSDLTITPSATSRVIQKCLQVVKNEVSLKDIASGTIYLNTLVNIQTGKEYELPMQSIYSFIRGVDVSPDGNTLAYTEYVQNAQQEHINDILWLVNAQAQVLTNLPLNRVDLGNLQWLDQERLIIEAKNENMIVVNPFTHKQEPISNELPGLETRHLPMGPWWKVEYSPDLKQVVYYSSSGPVLYDVVTKQILWYSTMQGDWGNPGWSPDGQEVVIAAGGQLYLINRSGQAKSIMDENLSNEGAEPVWSPDGRYIAFWNFDELLLYDRKVEQVLGLCVKNDWTTKPPLGWSPDGKQFWADGYVESGSKPYAYPVLIDINKWVVYIDILEMQNWSYAAPNSWLNSNP